jgi:hypothetical protein
LGVFQLSSTSRTTQLISDVDVPQLRAVAHRIVHDMSRAEDVIHEAFAQIAPGRFHLLARPFEKLLAPLGIIRSLSFPNAILGVLLVVLGE